MKASPDLPRCSLTPPLPVGYFLCMWPLMLMLGACTPRPGQQPVTAPPPSSASPTVDRRPIAPDFGLLNHEGRLVRLRDFRGKWVILYFYPEDDTPSCTVQARQFTALKHNLDQMSAVVIGVSPDPPLRHRLFRGKHDLQIILLSDPAHQVMPLYGAWSEIRLKDRVLGRPVRTTTLVDPGGRIAWQWPIVVAEGHAEEVRRKLAALTDGDNP